MRTRLLLLALTLACLKGLSQQPALPFVADQSFIPDLEYLQMVWQGSYKGVDPLTGNPAQPPKVLDIERTLTLNTDMTYTNESLVSIGNGQKVTLCYEYGTYIYDDHDVIYTVERDSILNLGQYVVLGALDYKVNDYTNDNPTTHAETVQFTVEENGIRSWIVFDPQLMSDRNPQMQAVYVMNASPLTPSSITDVQRDEQVNNNTYDMMGRIIRPENMRGRIVIHRGKKVILR